MQLDPSSHNIALVVDDTPESLGFVSAALEEIGMTVLVARDGLAAIELVKRVQPDVILMDAMMPGLDGFETCQRLTSPPISTDAPVIFMTGLSDGDSILRGLRSGGVDYITKPVNVDELIARLTTHLINSKMVRSARAALESFGHSVLAFHEDGSVVWGSPTALSGLEKSGLGSGAIAPVAVWLQHCIALPVSQTRPFEKAGLQLNYIGRSSTGELLARMSAPGSETAYDRLSREFGLTQRESEVLFWLSQGKTNRDIAEILDLSARTVNKHLEQVFQKQGVDNRTSAAVLADRTIGAGR